MSRVIANTHDPDPTRLNHQEPFPPGARSLDHAIIRRVFVLSFFTGELREHSPG